MTATHSPRSIWGIVGAILSVPLLAIMKICLSHANHPAAKRVALAIRFGARGTVLGIRERFVKKD